MHCDHVSSIWANKETASSMLGDGYKKSAKLYFSKTELYVTTYEKWTEADLDDVNFQYIWRSKFLKI